MIIGSLWFPLSRAFCKNTVDGKQRVRRVLVMNFKNWIDTFIDEKGIDLEHTFTVPGEWGDNLIPVGCVIDAMKQAPDDERSMIKRTLVAIDFNNGSVLHFLEYMAKAIAI